MVINCENPKVVCADFKPKPGEYPGLWSGYSVTFTDSKGFAFEADAKAGVRGIDIPVIVVVSDTGEVYIDR